MKSIKIKFGYVGCIIFFMTCFFAFGCAPTPTNNAIVNKQEEIYVEKGAKSASVPSNTTNNDNKNENGLLIWQEVLTTKSGAKISINAHIKDSETSDLDIVRTKICGFSDEMIQVAITALSNSNKIYKSNGSYQTKEEVEADIISVKQKNAKLALKTDANNASLIANNNLLLADLENLYSVLPSQEDFEKSKEEISIDTLNNTNTDIFFSMSNESSGRITVFDHSESMDANYSAYLAFSSNIGDAVGGVYLHKTDNFDENAKKAIETATKAVDSIGVTDMTFVKCAKAMDTDENATSEDEYMYSVFFMKKINELSVPFVIENAREKNVTTDGETKIYRPSWEKENIKVDVDERGENIINLTWSNPTQTIETNSHSNIIRFNEMKEIFSEKINYFFAEQEQYSNEYEIIIDEVFLGYDYLPMKDVFNEYVLTPCWFLFGYDNANDAEKSEVTHFAKAQFIINAIDGRIIT